MFKHILVPIDGSDTALLAVQKAVGLAEAFGSDITLLYVVDPYPFTGVGADFAYGQAQYLTAAHAEAQTALDAARASIAPSAVNVITKVGEGHAVHEGIAQAQTDSSADLVVMGSHGRKGIEKWVLGSVTQRVLSDVKVPVMVVRE